MRQVLAVFGLLNFTMLQLVLAWRPFWKLWIIYFFNFSNFFSGCGKPRITNCGYCIRRYGGPLVFVFCLLHCNCVWSKSGSWNLLEILNCSIGTFYRAKVVNLIKKNFSPMFACFVLVVHFASFISPTYCFSSFSKKKKPLVMNLRAWKCSWIHHIFIFWKCFFFI